MTKLTKLQNRLAKLDSNERSAFDAAIVVGRSFTPARALNAAEWHALWGGHLGVDARKRGKVEDLANEIAPLSNADYALVMGPKQNNWFGNTIKNILKFAAIIALVVSLLVGIGFGISTFMNGVKMANLSSADKQLAEVDSQLIGLIGQNQDAIGDLKTGVEQNSKDNAANKEAIDKNAEDIKNLQSDVGGIKADVQKANEKADSAAKAVEEASKSSGSDNSSKNSGSTGTSATSGTSDQSVDNTKLIQTLVGSNPDGVIGPDTKKAVDDAAKVINDAKKEEPKPTPTPEPEDKTSIVKPVVTSVTAEAKTDGAVVMAIVNPGGAETHYYVEYGTTTAYGSQTSPKSITDVSNEKIVTVDISGLASGKKIYYRLVVSNIKGSNNSGLKNFTTTQSVVMVAKAVVLTGNCTVSKSNDGKYTLTILSLGDQPDGRRVWVEQAKNGVSSLFCIGETGASTLQLTNTFSTSVGPYFKVHIESKAGEPGAVEWSHPGFPGGKAWTVSIGGWFDAN